jgi:hypothetical protein
MTQTKGYVPEHTYISIKKTSEGECISQIIKSKNNLFRVCGETLVGGNTYSNYTNVMNIESNRAPIQWYFHLVHSFYIQVYCRSF